MSKGKEKIKVLRGFYFEKKATAPGDILEVTSAFAREMIACHKAEAYAETAPQIGEVQAVTTAEASTPAPGASAPKKSDRKGGK